VSDRVLRRRRAVALAGLLVFLSFAWIALQAALGAGGGSLTTTGSPGGAMAPISSHVWVVRPGDTLWRIAEAVSPGSDVRPLVDRLSAETGGVPLEVGQHIAVP